MNKTRTISFLFITFFCALVLRGQFGGNTKVGTTVAQFLKIPVGARAQGMGSAFVAVANDATAIYWNPAGLAEIEQNEFSVTHLDWILDTAYDYATLAISMGRFGTIGIDAAFTTMEEMKVRTVEMPDGTGERFDANDLCIGLAYGKRLTNHFAFGVHGKFVQQTIWHSSASSVALDIGALYKFEYLGIQLGMSVSNFGGDMQMKGVDTFVYYDQDHKKLGDNDKLPANLETSKYSLPLMFRLGVSTRPLNTRFMNLIIALDATHPRDNVEDVNIGAELTLANILSLRTGYRSIFNTESEESINLGFGFKLYTSTTANIFMDYAYSPFGRLGDMHRYTIGANF